MKNPSLYLLAILLSIGACKKDLVQKFEESQNTGAEISVSKMSEIKVPANFKWELTKAVSVKVVLEDNTFGALKHKIQVFVEDPAKTTNSIAEGALSLANEFESTVSVPSSTKELYLVRTTPDNSKVIEKVAISGSNQVVLNVKSVLKKSNSLGKSAGPDCSTGCNSTISLTSGTYNANSGVVCITNSNISGNLNIANGATVRVCGSGSINSISLGNSATLIFTSSANITLSQKLTSKGTVTNYGTLVTSQDLEANSGTFTNHGTLTVGNDLKTVQTGTLVNNGTLVVEKNHQTDKGSTTNNCYFRVKKSWEINGTSVSNPVFFNNGYLQVDDNSNINDLSAMTLPTGAMFRTKTIDFKNGKVIGTAGSGSATSLLKTTNGGNVNSGARVSGLVQFCHTSSIPGAVLTSGASAGCTLYLPITACNPVGNGTAPNPNPNPDTDGDGIIDASDCYPSDPNKAFCNAVPTGTLAFEDQWPFTGDYDMNDVVVTYNYNVVSNAANNVVRLEATYVLRATGGSFRNGFAVQLPVDRNKVSGVTGATLEAGQTKAVLVIFNDMHQHNAAWNTVPSAATCPTTTFTVSFNVTNGPSLAAFGLGAYNPFIWNGTAGFGRGYEIHLPGQLPTDLATGSLFGTGRDGSNLGSGDTYVSNNGRFPWAINIPASFDYPKEKSDVNSAYTKFASWVNSGGSSFSNWYSNTVGYRNAANIY
jgi:LruC domain-containing protein